MSPFKCLQAYLVRPAVAWMLAVFAVGVHAGSFSAIPVRVLISGGANSATLALENTGDQPVVVQSEILAWSQRGGQDAFEPTSDLIVSPPIFKVTPGAKQTIRVGRLGPVDPSRELSYRLFLQEVPPASEPGQRSIDTVLRLSLPVFIVPAARVAPVMTWSAARGPQGGVLLSLANSGTAHVQGIDCVLRDATGGVIAESPLGGYVLPGQSRTWTVKVTGALSGERIHLKARTDAGDASAELKLE